MQRRRNLGARHHSVLHIVGGAHASHRAERVLAAFPQQVALFGRARHAKIARAAQHAGLANLRHLLFHHFPQAFQFDQQDRPGVHRIARVGSLFHHPQHHPVEHLHGHRRNGARRNFGHRASGAFVRFVDRQNRLHGLRLAHQPRGHPRDQYHGTLRAGQQARQVVPRQIRLLAAGLHHRPIGQDHFEPQHVVGGDPVRQRMRSPGILGHVPADGAGALAGRIGRVEIAAGLHRPGDVQVDHSRLDHGALVLQVDCENGIHAREADQDTALPRDGSAREAGARSAAHAWHAVFAGDFEDPGHVLSIAGEHHHVRPMFIDPAVVFVKRQVFRPVERAPRS